ncbi:MAG TPA: histidinol-phosphate transaminase, partial [Paracoccaceae bacterium]|nr:histidinol-phosphate transaminase [Paracoccaceae bacterium]
MPGHATIRPRPGVLDIAPYVGGSARIAGANRAIKLSANENPHGPSPRAVEAYRAAAGELNLYPESHGPLADAIAAVHGIEADRIVLGNGSDELIALLCKAYAGEGDEVLYSAHGFLMYRLSALSAGATPVAAPERELTADVDAMIAAITERTRLVFLANPNNPTGTMLPGAEVARLAGALPPNALLVLDAAYAEYLRPGGDDGGLALIADRENVVMTRTFSKIYGLAALRLGWAYAPAHVVDVLHRVRGPFNVTRPALAAGEAAMRDQEWVDRCRVLNEVWRDWLAREIAAAGLPVVPSRANFLLVEAGERTAAFDRHLQSRGLIARRVDGYGLPGHIRITVGDEAGCRAVA